MILALALGLGLGLGLHSTKPSSPPPVPLADTAKIGSALDESYRSTIGAWNGPGVAQTYQTFPPGLEGAFKEHSTVIYYQHHSGEIRWIHCTVDGRWLRGPPEVEVVATDAKNSTAIAAMHYDTNFTSNWHVFYIDVDHRIQHRFGSNQSATWTTGSLHEANLIAYDGDLVGLQACWSGYNESTPIRIFYASDNTTFEECLWHAPDDRWTWQRSWKGYNGAAGVGCFNDGPPPWSYIGFVNPNNGLEYWYQYRTAAQAGQQAEWYKCFELTNVHPSSSLEFTGFLCISQQQDSNAIRVSIMQWNGSDTRQRYDFLLDGDFAGISGTHLTGVTRFSTKNATRGENMYIFYQSVGNDVTQYSHNMSYGSDETERWGDTRLSFFYAD